MFNIVPNLNVYLTAVGCVYISNDCQYWTINIHHLDSINCSIKFPSGNGRHFYSLKALLLLSSKVRYSSEMLYCVLKSLRDWS